MREGEKGRLNFEGPQARWVSLGHFRERVKISQIKEVIGLASYSTRPQTCLVHKQDLARIEIASSGSEKEVADLIGHFEVGHMLRPRQRPV